MTTVVTSLALINSLNLLLRAQSHLSLAVESQLVPWSHLLSRHTDLPLLPVDLGVSTLNDPQDGKEVGRLQVFFSAIVHVGVGWEEEGDGREEVGGELKIGELAYVCHLTG